MVSGIAESFHIDPQAQDREREYQEWRKSPETWEPTHDPDPPTRRTRAIAESRWGLRRKCCHGNLDITHTEAVQSHCDGWNWWVARATVCGCVPSLWVEVPQVIVAVLLFALVDTQVSWVLNTRGISYATTHALVDQIWRREDQKFKVVLGCIEVKCSLAMLDPHLKKMSQLTKPAIIIFYMKGLSMIILEIFIFCEYILH